MWAFSPTEVAGAPLRTALVVGRVVGLANAPDGSAGVRVEIDASDPDINEEKDRKTLLAALKPAPLIDCG